MISEQYKEESVYRKILESYSDTGSVEITAGLLGVSPVKVRKVLITEGLWSSPKSLKIQQYLGQGFSTKEIADALNMTVKAVQQYLPYSRGLYQGDTVSADAQSSSDYRERIRIAKERAVKKNEAVISLEGWNPTENPEIKTRSGSSAEVRAESLDVLRLHLELRRDYDDYTDIDDDGHRCQQIGGPEYEEITRVLTSYGKVKHGVTVSRDILVPSDMPLFALHYAIQQSFGWQNSSHHRFELPPKQFASVTGNRGENWLNLIGVLFRSPIMKESDLFWADDYSGGSIKTWLRDKYTGPYMSLCHGEGIIQCDVDAKTIKHKNAMLMLTYGQYNGKTYISDIEKAPSDSDPGIVPVSEYDPNTTVYGNVLKKEIVRLDDCDSIALQRWFEETGAGCLLERLPIEQILAFHDSHDIDVSSSDLLIYDTYAKFMNEDLRNEIGEILNSKPDLPTYQPVIGPPTDVLYYYYDPGDNWKIRITGSRDASTLIEQGRTTQQDLDDAVKKVCAYHRPVCIAADGLQLIDDVGGIGGYIRFLRAIHPEEEAEYWGNDDTPDNWGFETREDALKWARSLGWTDKTNLQSIL